MLSYGSARLGVRSPVGCLQAVACAGSLLLGHPPAICYSFGTWLDALADASQAIALERPLLWLHAALQIGLVPHGRANEDVSRGYDDGRTSR